jgi:inosine/xanthosine triphosphatase
MRVGIGGTFNIIHVGHELLFETAFSAGDFVQVGLTSDEFARSIKKVPVRPYDERRRDLERFLSRYGRPFEVVRISDPMGTAVESKQLDAIVVSPETRATAKEINERRRRNGLGPLRVLCIREVKADDAKAVSASRIVRGEIDRDGKRWTPIRVAIATGNRTKVRAVKNVFTQIFGYVEVVEVHVEGAPHQPLGEGTIKGSIDRAKAALARSDADYGVGVEAGLFRVEALGKYFDIQYCTIVDSDGNASYGHGPGFEYPPSVTRAALEGAPVGEVMSRLTGIERIGHRGGSIGYLSNGAIDRTSLTEIAVLMALIPRIRGELYEEGANVQASSASDTAWR